MKKKTLSALLILSFIVSAFCLSVSAEEGVGKAYTYDHKQNAVAVPDPYTVSRVLYGGASGFNAPADFVYSDGKLYILNTGAAHAVTVLDSDFALVSTIDLTKDGQAYALDNPKSMWIDRDGSMLFADYGKKRIIRTDALGHVLAEYTGPENTASETNEFLPYKVLTDYLGRIYVLSEGEYRGILRFSQDGEFTSYFGAKSIQATASVLLDMTWRRFMSETQIANSARYLPTEYSNMTIDENGFLFVTSGSSSAVNEFLVKLNTNGSNVLEGSAYGDYNLGHFSQSYYKTSLNAVAVDDEGFITVADKTWNRLMQYSEEGELLYIFAGSGDAAGTFSSNSRMLTVGNQILVVDGENNAITVFQPTAFGSRVREGCALYESGLFEESIEPWEEVLADAGNYEMAYVGIGKALQLKEDYKGAMEYFRKGYSKKNYSKAYQRYRSEVMRTVFPTVMTALVVIVVLLVIGLRMRRRKVPKEKKPPLDRRGKLAYVFYCMLHPFDGHAEMRYNGKGSAPIATGIVLLWFLLSAVQFHYRGFIFNSNEPEDFSVFALLATTVGLSFLFCLSNWLLSTFFEGKGTLKNVWIHFGYGLVPMLAVMVLDVVLSNLLTQDESFFIQYLNIFGMAYTVFLVVIGNGELHQYSFKKNILSILASCVGVLIMMFIVFLVFNLFMQIKDFATSVFEEAFYRFQAGF